MMLLALFLSYIIAGVSMLQIKELHVPESIEPGQVVRLECVFELEQENLYSVKWYKDNIEFYRFVPTTRKADYFFKAKGVTVDVSKSSKGKVTLKNTNRWTEGNYRCEVSADAPSFDSKSSEKFMTVEKSLIKCESLSLTLELISVNFLPNLNQLGRLCPQVKTFLECQTKDLEWDGLQLKEIANSSYKAEATEAKILLGKKSLVSDLCDDDTQFHKEYILTRNCIGEYIEEAGGMCYDQDYMTLIDRFYDDMYPLEQTSRSDVWDEKICLKQVLEMTCLVTNLGAECGSGGEGTAMAVLQSLKPLLRAGKCSGVKNKRELKSSLLEFLKLDKERKTKVKKVFRLF